MKPMHHKQRGVTLVVALIMLILLTLLVLTSANLGNSSLQTVGNMQQRNEVYTAAQETVEQAISTKFYETPSQPIADKCNNQNNTKCIDTNGDGTTDVTVKLDPAVCMTAQPYVPPNLADNQEVTCAQEQDQAGLAMETKRVNTQCWNTVWELRATANDAVTQATTNFVQGVAVPVPSGDVPAVCMPPSS